MRDTEKDLMKADFREAEFNVTDLEESGFTEKECNEPDFKKLEITIVGLGLIGGSYALALRKLKPKKIWAVDIDQDVLLQAERIGAIDQGFDQGAVPLQKSDLVIICLYPQTAVSFVKKNLNYFKRGAIITDAVGNKQKVVEEINSMLRTDLDFVGGHPLAGKESGGFGQASAAIFQGANYLLTPVRGNKANSLVFLKKLIRSLGCREPICLEPAEHDKIIALTSQLPHVLAAALINSSESSDLGNLTGGSFRDATRVASMNVGLWSELLLGNRENILTEIQKFMDNITRIQEALKSKDLKALAEILERASTVRGKF